MRYVMKCRNRKCTTEIIADDADRCPECGTTDIECESIQDLDTMGISETRIFVPSGHPVDPVFCCVIFEAMDDDETMPFITLAKKFASNAKKIRVTVDIIE